MASGFVSSVLTRLLHGKGKDKHAHHDATESAKKLLEKSSSSSSPPPPAPAVVVKKRGGRKTSKPDDRSPAALPPSESAVKKREPTKRKSPLLASLRKRTRPLSCFVARPESPTETEGMLRGDEDPKKASKHRGHHRGELQKNPTSQQRKEKKPRRPLSCIVQPPSPRLPAVDRPPKLQSRSTEAATEAPGSSPSGAAPTRHAKAQERSRPVSCFVEIPQKSPPPYSRRPQQPSPQTSDRPDQPARRMGTPEQTLPAYSAISSSSSSLFVSPSPCAEIPPQSISRPVESQQRDLPYYAENSQPPVPYYADSSQQPMPYNDETPQKLAPYCGETPQQSSPYCGETQQQSSPYYRETPQQSSPHYGETPQQSSPYYGETPQQSSPYYGETPQQSSLYFDETPQQSSPYYGETPQQSSPSPYYGETPQQSSPHYGENSQPPSPYYGETTRQSSTYYAEALHQQLSYYGGTPRQSTPVMGSSGLSEHSEVRRSTNCPLNPCPFQSSSPPQACSGGRSYDLKTYFPSAVPARQRPPRPQSACFLCEPQPCCVEARRPCRPTSQCYVPGCNLLWSGPKPTRGTLQDERPGESTPASPSEGEQVLPHAVARSPIPRPRSSYLVTPESESSSATPPREASPAPRAARRTLLPRPKSACLLSAELESSPAASPSLGSSCAPSPPPTRFALQRYRSADCLDRVDEIVTLDLSPPPAKPLSHFIDSDGQRAKTTKENKKHDEIYTSAEMLEKLGQPRSRSQQPGCRPVSCFVGSADESGYLSSATLGGSGWLGGLSASTGDILEILDGDEMNAADDELSFERASSFRKAWSVCSLLRQDSIQDRSFTVMRKRRQKMKNRRQSNQRSSSTETDEGVELKAGNSASSLLDEDGKRNGESLTVAGIPLDGTLHVPGSRGQVRRLHSTHMKAWQIRLRRKQMLVKRRSYDRLNSRMETLV